MSYSLKELREKLDEKLSNLGIDLKFRQNPEYASILWEIQGLIDQMNTSKENEAITVTEENGEISFSWPSPTGENYSMSISASSPDTFKCVFANEKREFMSDGKIIKGKNFIEKVANVDKNGLVTLTTNGAMLNNNDCAINEYNIDSWSESKKYTSQGVMYERLYTDSIREKLYGDIDRLDANSALVIQRNAKAMQDNYDTMMLLQRKKLDIARVLYVDKVRNVKYNAETLLNQNYGLRDMILQTDFDYPQDVVISPLSKEQIEKMIETETNPLVAEGLRDFAANRESYYYNSAEATDFIRDGFSETQNISR